MSGLISIILQKDKEEREKIIGELKPLNSEDHKELYEATGVDIDGIILH